MLFAVCGVVFASTGPTPSTQPAKIEDPKDRPFPGQVQVNVDVTDLDRRIVHVKEHLTGIRGETVLLYPEWLPGDHAPTGTLDRFAGFRVSAGGNPVTWTRDSVDLWAFHVHAPKAATSLDLEFDYLSATSDKVGKAQLSPDLIILEWNSVILYPAGYFSRQIPVSTTVEFPAGFKFATALEIEHEQGGEVSFKTADFETVVDSPIYAGRHFERFDLDPDGKVGVHLDVFADRAEMLGTQPEQIGAYRALVRQADLLYGSRHYRHYDFLYSLSDSVEQNGLEHLQSSENGHDPEAFRDWEKNSWERDLLAHEYTHSWNGKFRRPADLWTPNYNVPMQGSLLWVYEGQTQYWGWILAGRSGLWSKQQTLDEIAYMAAFYDMQTGRRWRPLLDTTNDEAINPRRPMPWRDFQRFEDYYNEGAMIWLDADTLIREKSAGKRSLDDFAKAFFGVNDGSTTILTYTFDDVVKALNAIEPYDWAGFLNERVKSSGKPSFMDGVRRGGYKLVYTDSPNELEKIRDDARKRLNLTFSVGLEVEKKSGLITTVIWDSPAFKAHLIEGAKILAINGLEYSSDLFEDVLRAAKGGGAPIELITQTADHFAVVKLDYHEGLRYPHLERDTATPARLDDIIAPRH
jgi:predicted metalloprotease with PDZ domain